MPADSKGVDGPFVGASFYAAPRNVNG